MRFEKYNCTAGEVRTEKSRLLFSLLLIIALCASAIIPAYAAETGVQEARNSVVRICTAATLKYWGTHEDIYLVTGTGICVGAEGEAVSTVLTTRQMVNEEDILTRAKSDYKELHREYNYDQMTVDDLRVWILADGEAYEVNYARGVTISQIADLAILKTENAISNRIPAVIADPDSAAVTDVVYAIGYPGYSDVEDVKNTSASNYEDLIVKAYPSSVENMSVTQGNVVKTHAVVGGIDHIQHAASVSDGNYGSPLVTEAGFVVGINTWISSKETDTANFAIDSSNIMTFLRQNNVSYMNADDLQQETESEPEPVPETDPETEPESEKKTDNTLYIVIAAAALILALALVLVLRKKKAVQEAKKQREYEVERQLRETAVAEEKAEAERKAREEKERLARWSAQNQTVPVGRKLIFMPLVEGAQAVELWLEEDCELKLGRDKRSDLILNPHDSKLSGVHCLVKCHGAGLRVQDANSTNGTYVNNVPLPKPKVNDGHIHGDWSVLMQEGDTLRAGSYEYRVHFANRI